MAKYIEMMRIRFLMMLAYRTNYYSGILIYSINIGAYYFLWKAIYASQGTLQNLSLGQMTTYVAVAWMARAFYFNNIDREISIEVREGKVAVELIRPYNYLLMKMMQALGEGVFRLFFFSVPGLLLLSFFLPLQLTVSLQTFGYFAVATAFSFIINTELNLLAGMVSFFLLSNEGLLRAKRFIIDLFSGLILPISFYPEWAQMVMKYLPFQAISYVPTMIFTGGYKGNAIETAIMWQLAWVLGLLAPIAFMWLSARKRLVVQGG